MKKQINRGTIAYAVLLAILILLNALAWCSTRFADFHTEYIFPIWTSLYGRLTSAAPFSVGEYMLGGAVIWLLLILLLLFFMLFFRKNTRYKTAVRRFLKATSWLILTVGLIMTQNCFIQYHCTPIERSLPGYGKEYSLTDLMKLRNLIVRKCNALCLEMERSEEGELVYSPGQQAMQEEARRCVQKLGEGGWPQLMGFQVTPKPLKASIFMSQQKMQGYYFPFSMEANYNNIMEIANKPATMCHEIAHTHGYIYEDEANFLAFLSCIGSEDPFFRYSGWLSVLNYVDNDLWHSADRKTYYSQIRVLPQVRRDNQFLSEEVSAMIEKEAVLDSDTVEKAADIYVDTTLKVNGVKSGKLSYSHVVRLLLEYFDEEES